MATLTEEAQTPPEKQPEKQEIQITIGGKDLIPDALPVLTRAFHDDAVFKYLMIGLNEDARAHTLSVFMKTLIKGSIMNEGLIIALSTTNSHSNPNSNSNSNCCFAVLVPPGKKIDNPSTALQAGILNIFLRLKARGMKHIIEHGSAVKRARREAFSRKQVASAGFWYLFILGTDPEYQGQGLGGVMIERVKEYVRTSHQPLLPLWLESSSEGSRKLYKRHGFEEVHEMILGKGVVGIDGIANKAGEGVKSWGMIWRPEY